jgi:hypothetical protein
VGCAPARFVITTRFFSTPSPAASGLDVLSPKSNVKEMNDRETVRTWYFSAFPGPSEPAFRVGGCAGTPEGLGY